MLFTSLIETKNLEQAIIENPLIVTPDILLGDVIALMSNARATCSLGDTVTEVREFLCSHRVYIYQFNRDWS
jgi:hypothetical protein